MSLETQGHERAVREFLKTNGLTQPRSTRSARTVRGTEASSILDELSEGRPHRSTFSREMVVHFTGPAADLETDEVSQEGGGPSFEHTGEYRVTAQHDPNDWDPYHEEDR